MSAKVVLLMAVLAAPATNFVRGIVRGSDGQPVGNSDVWLFDRQSYMSLDGQPAAHAVSDASGRFSLALPANASFGRNFSFDVFTHKQGAGMAVADVDARLLPVSDLTLSLQAFAPVKLRIIDPDGEPVRDASVKVNNFSDVSLRGNYWLPTAAPDSFAGRTNVRGEVTFELCDPLRSLSLSVEAPGYGLQMPSLSDGSNPPLRLGSTGKLRGRLVGVDPKQTAGALVRIMSIPAQPNAAMGLANVRADAAGGFDVPAIASGEVRVIWVEHAPGSSIFLEKEVLGKLRDGGTLELEVPVVRGVRVHGTVLDEKTSKPLSAMPVHVVFYTGRPGTDAWSVLTDNEGHYEVYVPPGAGRATVQAGPLPAPWLPAHSDHLDDEFPAEGDERGMPDFVVRRGIMLTGTVVDDESRPVPQARVQAAAVEVSQSHYHRVVAETDTKGRFSLGPVDGDMVLALMAADPTRASSRILPIEPSQIKGSIVLIIKASAMAGLSGRIVDSDGKPIADALVQAGPDMAAENWEYVATKALLPISYLTARTDQEGNYVLPNPVPLLGRYYIQIICSGFVVKRLPLLGSGLSPGKQTLEDLVLEREQQK